MTPDTLDSIRYLPTIRSRHAELKGYNNLTAETKRRLTPIIALGKHGRTDDPERILDTIAETVGGNFFLDLNAAPGQTCAGFEGLCDQADNFAAWRRLAARSPLATPVALLRADVPERPFIRQVINIEQASGVVAIRSRRPAQDLPALQAALSAVEDVNNALVVLDFAYIRGAMEGRENEALRVITALRSIDPAIRIAAIASSYPKAISAYGERSGTLEIVEREFHSRLGGNDVVIYGDHSSIYPVPFEASVSRFVPRVDYCLDYEWVYRRARVEEGGYVACAQQIVNLPDWEAAFAEVSWGAGIIRETAESGQIPTGFGSPANWIAARVNMHIERQTSLGNRQIELPDADEDDGEF